MTQRERQERRQRELLQLQEKTVLILAVSVLFCRQPLLAIALGPGCLFEFRFLSVFKLVFGSILCILLLGFLNKKQRRLLKSGQVLPVTGSRDKEES